MRKILKLSEVKETASQQRNLKNKIVLAGGCFDILHSGHLEFLKNAKNAGDILFLFLESDENIKKRKGENRPINNINTRASILSSIPYVDYIIPLKYVTKSQEYDKLIVQIKPDVIAITKGDKYVSQRMIQCELVGAKLQVVVENIPTPSTTDLIKYIK